MEEALLDILQRLRAGEQLDADGLAKLVRTHNQGITDAGKRTSKRALLRFYFDTRANDPQRWSSWGVEPALEDALLRVLRAKPRRTASGVATVTVITKPWPCGGDCVFCPNDLRMPKSYRCNEPACQRAERNWFDPYLQVTRRLHALEQMGHVTDKVELIVLGGTWSDYTTGYRLWFTRELFRALNETGTAACEAHALERQERYLDAGFPADEATREAFVEPWQSRIDAGELNYNQAFDQLYRTCGPWRELETWQHASWDELERQQRENEHARHRCVGLVVETRPDRIDPAALTELRRLGCTKVQMGVQSVDEGILALNHRPITRERIARAFELLRLFGFKTHAHFMVNLPGSTPERDIADYHSFVTDPRFLPDEVKLYPCVLLTGTELERRQGAGFWEAYPPAVLERVLLEDMAATQPYMRISRMIRDFSASDILAGNRTANLRQALEERAERDGRFLAEIRHREVAGRTVATERLVLESLPYETTATNEVFLQWVLPETGQIAGFLRLSLPKAEALARHGGPMREGVQGALPIRQGQAMVREVHVYGKAEHLHQAQEGTQHLGLGRALVAEACRIAREAGYAELNVISAVGTRAYYRKLGFVDAGLYQVKAL